MNMFSLRTLIDDILLIVRNNNISESEDLSRDQIASWILQYKAYFAKKENEKDEQSNEYNIKSNVVIFVMFFFHGGFFYGNFV